MAAICRCRLSSSAAARRRLAELAVADLPAPSSAWARFVRPARRPNGTSNQAVFALRVVGKGTVWVDKLSLMPEETARGLAGRTSSRRSRRSPGAHPLGWQRRRSGPLPLEERDRRPRSARAVREPQLGADRSERRGHRRILPVLRAGRRRPLVCVSFSDGPQSAADLVEYCNGPADDDVGRSAGRRTVTPPPTRSNTGSSATRSAATTTRTSRSAPISSAR